MTNKLERVLTRTTEERLRTRDWSLSASYSDSRVFTKDIGGATCVLTMANDGVYVIMAVDITEEQQKLISEEVKQLNV